MSKIDILLADCEEEEVASLAEGFARQGRILSVRSRIANWKRTGKASELKRYAVYFWVGFRYFFQRKRFGLVVGWQQFYALIFSFFCSLFHVSKENTVMALNFTYKEKRGRAAKLYRWFMGRCLDPAYMDYLHVLSESYADAVSREFFFPRERILVVPFGVNDDYEKLSALPAPEGFEKEGYALAIGRSNRDYDFLIQAWEPLAYPLVILADTYRGSTSSAHITIRRDVAGEDSLPWIANCGLMVIPIDDGRVCSGDTVLLTAMSAARRILVTEPSALAEMYIKDGENALLAPKEEVRFREKVKSLLQERGGLGARAREDFLRTYSRESMGSRLALCLKEKQD